MHIAINLTFGINGSRKTGQRKKTKPKLPKDKEINDIGRHG